MWYILIVEYYLAIKRNEVWVHATAWMNLENTMLSEISQTQNNILYNSIYMKSRIGKSIETENRLVVA